MGFLKKMFISFVLIVPVSSMAGELCDVAWWKRARVDRTRKIAWWDLNIRCKDGRTLLHLAAGSSHSGVVNVLIERKLDVNAKDDFENTPLHEAVAGGRSVNAQMLVDHGADVDARNIYGQKPRDLASLQGHDGYVLAADGE